MDYLSVRNLSQYQHYKKRNPPWIKLHYSILDDYAFLELPEKSQLLYLKLLLIASRTENKIPLSFRYLEKVCRCRVTQALINPLLDSHFLMLANNSDCASDSSLSLSLTLREHNASTTLAPCKQIASTTKIERTEMPKEIREMIAKIGGGKLHE